MAISFTHQGRLWLILDEENIERIQENDPFEFDCSKAGPIALRIPFQITVAYAKKEELEKIQRMTDVDELVRYLSRGFKVTSSDHDRRYKLYRTIEEKK